MANVYTTGPHPGGKPEILEVNLQSLNWTPFATQPILWLDCTQSMAGQVRFAAESNEIASGGRVRTAESRSFATSKDLPRTRMVFCFSMVTNPPDMPLTDDEQWEKVQPIVQAIRSLRGPPTFVGFGRMFHLPPDSLLVESVRSLGWVATALFDAVDEVVAVSKSKLIVRLTEGTNKQSWMEAMKAWSWTQSDANQIKSIKESGVIHGIDMRSDRPDPNRGSEARAAMLALTGPREIDFKWWWLQIELPDVHSEDREMLANYCLENIRQDLLNAGYDLPRSEPKLEPIKDAGILEQYIWVRFSCPYSARACYVRYNDQMIDLGEGQTCTLCFYNTHFRKELSVPGIWDLILASGSIAPRALMAILPAIEDSPTTEYGTLRSTHSTNTGGGASSSAESTVAQSRSST